jgi:hypothetical protein
LSQASAAGKAKFVRPRGFGSRFGDMDAGLLDVRLSGSAVVDTARIDPP